MSTADIFGDVFADMSEPSPPPAAARPPAPAAAAPAGAENFPVLTIGRLPEDVVLTALILLRVGNKGITNGEAMVAGVDYPGLDKPLVVHNLRSRLTDLRRELGDDAKNPRLICYDSEPTARSACRRYFLSAAGREKVWAWVRRRTAR